MSLLLLVLTGNRLQLEPLAPGLWFESRLATIFLAIRPFCDSLCVWPSLAPVCLFFSCLRWPSLAPVWTPYGLFFWRFSLVACSGATRKPFGPLFQHFSQVAFSGASFSTNRCWIHNLSGTFIPPPSPTIRVERGSPEEILHSKPPPTRTTVPWPTTVASKC